MNQRFKPFFLHHQGVVAHMSRKELLASTNAVQRQRPRGFTVKVEPGDSPRTVKVGVSFCSLKDEFVKALGRSHVEQGTFVEINTRQLPRWLSEQAEKLLHGHAHQDAWMYTLKYVV